MVNERLMGLLADRYRIERELGAGGMANVYLAHDLRHDRKVALKVLKPELAAVIGAARFLAEIRTTANLQNPHILPLHDSGEIDGTVYYVMPFVDGESLRDRLAREKQLPIADAIRIATAVADALQHAHTHGVIHRDIKPENILLRDGHAVVADFGIALAASSAGSRMTETGMSLGTPHYMSPEQAMGERDLDARTDVYALGCVLYEMLTGQPPFTGPTAQSIVAKVITETPPPPSASRGMVGEELDAAVLTALQKLPADRFADAGQFARAIGSAAASNAGARPRRVVDKRGGPWRMMSAGLALLVVALLVVAAWPLTRGGRTVRGPSVYDAALPDSAPMTFLGAIEQSGYGLATTNLSISADGSFAAYPAVQGASTMLWTRSLGDARGSPITGTEGAASPAISPDGTRIVYLLANRVMVSPISGGPAKQLMVVGMPVSMQWLSPRQLFVLHTDGTKASWVDPETGPTREIGAKGCNLGRWLPTAGELLCGLNGIAWTIDTTTGSRHGIIDRAIGGGKGPVQGSDFRLIDGKYMVYISVSGELTATLYDDRERAIGRSIALVTGVRREGAGPAQFDIAANGTLVYAPGANAQLVHMVVQRAGTPAQRLPVEPMTFQRFDLSRDRRWLATVVQASQAQEIRVYDLKNGQGFTWLRAAAIRHALWNAGGTRLLVLLRNGDRSSIVYGSPSSAVAPDTLFSATLPASVPEPVDFSDEHTALVQDPTRRFVYRFDPSVRPIRFDSLALEARFVTVAPGGKLVCYQSLDGRIMVTTFPTKPERSQIAAAGVEPLWLSGTEVLYRAGMTWFVSRVDGNTGEPVGSPAIWGKDTRFSDTAGWSNRVSWDGGIIYAQGPEQTTARYLRVEPNWVSRMKAAVDSVNR